MHIAWYKDRYVNNEPVPSGQTFIEIGEPLRMISWFIDDQGIRRAGPVATKVLQDKLDRVFNELKPRPGGCKLTFDSRHKRALSNELDDYISYDQLFDEL